MIIAYNKQWALEVFSFTFILKFSILKSSCLDLDEWELIEISSIIYKLLLCIKSVLLTLKGFKFVVVVECPIIKKYSIRS